MRTVDDTALLVGDHNLTTGSDTSYAQAYVIAQFLSHPGFTTKPVSNDIALIRTYQPMQFNEGVSPVCLPWKYRSESFVGATVEACGWGDLDFGGPKSDVLNKVNLTVISNQECSTRLNSTITRQKMCTYTPSKDTCQVSMRTIHSISVGRNRELNSVAPLKVVFEMVSSHEHFLIAH